MPLHAWLPLAHPAAPSQVSALMSGVMTKVAVYGFIRIVFDLAGPPAWWWSMPVLFVGAVTAVMGVLYALMQRDLKRVLAYSTIENIGIVFVALCHPRRRLRWRLAWRKWRLLQAANGADRIAEQCGVIIVGGRGTGHAVSVAA